LNLPRFGDNGRLRLLAFGKISENRRAKRIITQAHHYR
jgi:hypothetical protein